MELNNFMVEVAYATPDKQYLRNVHVPHNTTVEQAILASGILKLVPDINLLHCKVGIFSKLCSLQDYVQPNDRVEIYRPLIIDPKDARRIKAKKIIKK